MTPEYTLKEFLDWLGQECIAAGSQRQLALKIGVHPQQLQDIRSGKVLPYPKVLKKLGWKRFITNLTFRPIEPGESESDSISEPIRQKRVFPEIRAAASPQVYKPIKRVLKACTCHTIPHKHTCCVYQREYQRKRREANQHESNIMSKMQ